MEKPIERWIKSGPTSQNHGTFLNFQKRTGDAPPLPPSYFQKFLHADVQQLYLKHLPKAASVLRLAHR